MALSTKTLKVLKDAGLDPADVALFSDEDLLGLPGVGPAVLADIRAMYPAPATSSGAGAVPSEEYPAVVGADTIEDLAAAAVRAGVVSPAAPIPAPAAPKSPEPPAPVAAEAEATGCVCNQPFKVTRTRQRDSRIERYCDTCGAVQASAGGRA